MVVVIPFLYYHTHYEAPDIPFLSVVDVGRKGGWQQRWIVLVASLARRLPTYHNGRCTVI